MFNSAATILELVFLAWIIVQGEYVRFYEREVFRMNKERFEERAKWRREKQEQTRRKNAIKTIGSSENTESPSPTDASVSANKTTNAKPVVVP